MQYIGGMRLSRFLLTACAFGLAISTHAEARPLDSYKSIIDRNPFGLKDPVAPPVKETNPPPTQVKKEDFYLTGISTIGNPKRPKAYLVAKDASKKEYDQKFYNLSIGDKQGDVTLQEIDAKGRRVKIVYLGEEKWLSMKENGVPAPSGGAPAMAGVPGAPGVPGMTPPHAIPAPLPLPTAGGASQAQPISYPNASNTRRPVRTTGNYGANYNAPGVNMGGGVPTVGTLTPGVTTPGVDSVARNSPPPGPQTDADVLKQILMMQSQKDGPPVPTF